MADTKDDFFEEEATEEVAEPEKIKLGEKEYSQDELNKLVGLGEKAAELEDKWNTKIDKLYPDYTKKSQELAEYKRREEEKAAEAEKEVQAKVSEGQQLSPDEQAKMIKQELKKYGVVTADEIYQFVANYDAAKELNTNIGEIIDEAKEAGKPTTTREELLDYMNESGIKNPEAAYKLKFEDELKEWEKKQLDTLKRPGLVTEGSSSAGSKEPMPVKVTKENLGELLKQAMEE